MKTYTQYGTVCIGLFLVVLAPIFIQIFDTGYSQRTDSTALLVIAIILVFALLNFHKLVIRIDGRSISFRFGIGLFGRRYPFSEIKSCRPARNNLLYGYGIRLTQYGWLYNVSGFKTIEIHLKNKDIIQIGTNKPQEICKLIEDKIENHKKSCSD